MNKSHYLILKYFLKITIQLLTVEKCTLLRVILLEGSDVIIQNITLCLLYISVLFALKKKKLDTTFH